MDLGSLAGIGLAFGAIVVSMIMEGGKPTAIIAPPAILLVLGGTFGACMAGGLLRDATGVIRWIKKALLGTPPGDSEVVETLVTLAERARREGLLALEEAARDIDDAFLKKGLELAVDGTDPDEVRELLEAEVAAKRADDKAGAKFFSDAGGFSPTIGIIGTVLGLVHVLESLNEPTKLGHLIAGAFIATLWGVMMANVVWLPLGNKLKRVSELEIQHMELLIEGISAIQAGANPRVVKLKLLALLPPVQRAAAEQEAA